MRIGILFVLNLITALVLFTASLPLHYIPSDDVTFVQALEKFILCFDNNTFCLPPDTNVYTKPIFTIAAFLVNQLFQNLLKLNTLEVIGLLGFLSTAFNVFLIQLLIGSSTKYKFSAYVLTYFLLYMNPTFFGVNYWWGYIHFSTSCVLIVYFFLFKFLETLSSTRQNNYLFGIDSTTSKYFLLTVLATLLAVFTHLSTWPYIIGWYGTALLTLVFQRLDPRIFPNNIRNTVNNRTFFSILCSPLGILSWLTIASVVSIIAFDLITLEVSGNTRSYLAIFQENMDRNLHAADKVRLVGRSLFYSTLPTYYLTVELPLVIVMCFSFIFIFATICAKTVSIRQLLLQHRRVILFLVANLIPLVVISVGPSTKLVRSFFPSHIASTSNS